MGLVFVGARLLWISCRILRRRVSPSRAYRSILRNSSKLSCRRNRAILLLGFESLARVAKIVAICVGDVHDNRLLIPQSKSDIEGRGRFVRLSEEALVAVGEWVAASGLKSGALFWRVRGRYIGENAMDTGSIGRMLRARQRLLKMSSSTLLSGHSFRVGGAQHLMKCGYSEIDIMLRGDCKNPRRWSVI